MKLIYLASAYSHPDKAVQEARYDKVVEIAARLKKEGHFIYSPIAHCHVMATRHGLPTDWQYWQHYLRVMLPRCDEVWIATEVDGWESSKGVTAEVELAKEFGIPVVYT